MPSAIWEYVTLHEGDSGESFMTCNLCSRRYEGRNVGNVLKHFESKHRTQFEKIQKIQESRGTKRTGRSIGGMVAKKFSYSTENSLDSTMLNTMDDYSNLEFDASEIPIKSVVCYRDQAEVFREFDVTLVAGTNKVVIEQVPQFINSSSILVNGDGDALLRDVQYKEEMEKYETTESDKVKEYKKQIEDIKEQIGSLEDQTKTLNICSDGLDYLFKGIVTPKKEETHINFSPAVGQSFSEALKYFETEKNQNSQRLREKAKQQRKFKEDIEALQQKINSYQPKERKLQRKIVVTLDSENGGEVTLNLSYTVKNVSWENSYDFKVDSKTKKAKLSYYATLTQTSGEDWNDVDLSLSTAEPNKGGTLPELRPLTAALKPKLHKPTINMNQAKCGDHSETRGFYFGVPHAGTTTSGSLFGNPVGGAPFAATFGGTSSGTPPAGTSQTLPATPPPVEKTAIKTYEIAAEQSLLSTTYRIPVKRTIVSKQDVTKVTVAILELPFELQYITIPIKRKKVFLVAYLQNTSEYHLLSGPIKVFTDNNFSNSAVLPQIAKGQHFKLELGTDSSIKVGVKPEKTYQKKTGILSNSVLTMYEQIVEIANNKDEEVTVTILEQVPKSTDEGIRISIIHPEVYPQLKEFVNANKWKKPEVGTVLNDNNILEWTVELKSSTKQELLLKYSVEHLPDETVQFCEFGVPFNLGLFK